MSHPRKLLSSAVNNLTLLIELHFITGQLYSCIYYHSATCYQL